MNGILTGPSLSLESSLTRKPSEPKWRNWQTQRTQNPPFSDGLVGSTPTFGTPNTDSLDHRQDSVGSYPCRQSFNPEFSVGR